MSVPPVNRRTAAAPRSATQSDFWPAWSSWPAPVRGASGVLTPATVDWLAVGVVPVWPPCVLVTGAVAVPVGVEPDGVEPLGVEPVGVEPVVVVEVDVPVGVAVVVTVPVGVAVSVGVGVAVGVAVGVDVGSTCASPRMASM